MKIRRLLSLFMAKIDLKTSNITLNIYKAANIHVNSAYPVDLIYQNRMIEANVIKLVIGYLQSVSNGKS